MAKSTKNTYKPAKKINYNPVVTMAEGGNVSELNYSERREYIEENYAPFISDAQMIFSIYDSGIEYDYKGDRKEVVNSIIEQYKELGDYTETTLPQETIYEIQDWDLVRKEIHPDTDEVIGETSLEEVSADNTYNFSYNGLVDLNWRVYHDEDYDRFFYVIMPHLGGDIRGNYGDAIILEGNDKEELFYRFYEGFISGGASIYIKFKDGSEIGFDSEQDSDVFYFRVSEVFEPTGMAQEYLEDFEKFDSWQGDDFLEETIDIYLARKGVAPKMMAGGSLNDETPMAYIQILGYDEGKWFNLTDYSDGQDVIDAIYDFMNDLNQQFGGNREEFEVADYEGFGDDLYDQYMSANEFEEIIEAYEKYENSDFPADVISAYKKESGSRNDSLSDVIDEMENNYFGKYDNLNDFGYEMVQQGVYLPSDYDIYITDTDKRIIAGEESDSIVDDMSFDDLMNIATDTKSDYEDEKSELEDNIVALKEEIKDLTDLQNSADDDDEYEIIAEQIEEKEIELEDAENSYVDIDSRFEDKAREEARELVYDEIYDRLENDLSSWLEEYGYTSELENVPFLSIDYDKIGDDLSSDYLIVEYDGEMYFFNNYAKGGRITASARKPKYDYYIVENSTKKLVSGYPSKAEASEQRKLLVQQYPSMRFEIYPLANLESKTDLDVYAKKDYVELSTLDKIKKVSVDTFRYGKEKVGQANAFLERNDVKGKINRGARNVADKTKQGFNWLRNQWNEADFGDGKGRAKFFADGGGVGEYFKKFENDFSSTRKGGVKNYSVDIDLENGEQLRGGDLDFKDGNDALFLYERIKKKGEYRNEKIEDIQLIANFKNGDYESVDIPRFDEGGGVENGYMVFNYTDNLYANYDIFSTKKEANNFIKEFRNRYKQQGYYRDSNMNKIAIEDIDLEIIPSDFNPFRKFNGGGAVSDEIIIKSGNNGNLKVIYHAIKNQRTELNSNEVFEQEKIKGKSVFLFVNDELYDEFIADGDENKYADGGVVGQEIVFDDSGETNTGVIRQITDAGDYVVATDDDRTVLAQKDLDIISLGKMRRKVKEVEEKKGLFSFFENGGELYDVSLPIGFYVKINPNYTATIRNLNSFEKYLERKDEIFGKEFGEITYVDKSASKEWVTELKRLIAKKKSELATNGTGQYKVGDSITIFRNQADRDGYVVAVDNNEILVEYEMPNGTSALNIIDLSLPEYDKNNYKKNYTPISYDKARSSKKWSDKIDANRLINNPQGSAKRFADGGEIKLSKKQKDEIKEHIADYYYNNELIDNYEEWEMDYMLEDKNGRIILKSGYAENDVMKKIIIYFELNNFSDIDLIDKEIQLYGDTILSDNYGDNDYDSVQDWQKNNFANGGKTEEVYIEFLNKEKGYKEDVKHFNSYEEAVEWARKNFDKFDSDMIKYKYANGGGIENAEMPTRERTTITKPTTTPTTTPSKPDKDSPYKPKGIPKPKATKM